MLYILPIFNPRHTHPSHQGKKKENQDRNTINYGRMQVTILLSYVLFLTLIDSLYKNLHQQLQFCAPNTFTKIICFILKQSFHLIQQSPASIPTIKVIGTCPPRSPRGSRNSHVNLKKRRICTVEFYEDLTVYIILNNL